MEEAGLEFPWQRMDVDEYADFERSQGTDVIKVNGVYWRRVRPCFYRPLLAFREYPSGSVSAPRRSLLGTFQHAVPSGEESNSLLNLMLFEHPAAYTLESLEHSKRKQVKHALRQFAIRRLERMDEFRQKAYPVYLAFYARTHYGYGSERRDPGCFSAWADSLYRFPKIAILGAFRGDELEAVGISQWVEDTLIYSTVFCNDESLKLNVTSVMLHQLRAAAATCSHITQIFVGMYKYQGATGIDGFYFARGCSLVSKPAWARVNPVAKVLLRYFAPGQFRRLYGSVDRNDDWRVKAARLRAPSPAGEGNR